MKFLVRLVRQKVSAIGLAIPLLVASGAHAQSELSVAASVLPVASVLGTVSVAGAAAVAGASVVVVGGALLTVHAVELSAKGTVYVLTRASDGAKVSVEVLGSGLKHSALAVGTVITVSAIGAGLVLSAGAEVLAFIPNALGQALLHNERRTW